MRLSIRSSAFLMVLVPTLLPALALSAWFTAERVRDARAELQSRGERESLYLADASELALLVGDADALSRLATSNIKAPGAARAVLFLDGHGAVLAAAGSPWEVGLARQCWLRAVDCRGGEQRRVFDREVRGSVQQEDGGAFGTPGGGEEPGDVLLGRVVLSFDPQALASLQRTMLQNAALSTVLALLVAALIANLFSRRLSVPMQQLSTVVARIRGGDLGARARPSGTGELRELEDGVNAMADRVEAAAADLNRRVDEATAELSGALLEREQRNRELDHALERAEAASRAKDLFLARMSHELRTPLSTVTGYARLMQRSENPEQRADFFRPIEQASDILLRTVDDILDFVRLESGALHLERRAFGFAECIGDAVRMQAPVAQEKGLGLECALQPELPAVVLGDSLRLAQVITNLVSNAIKFTERGCVRVSAGVASREGAVCRVVLSVSDTGIGIPAQSVAHLFQPFAQADESMTRRFGGSGLGLSITASIVAALGGAITLDSTPGAGTTVRVELPLEVAPEDAARAPPVPEAATVPLPEYGLRCLVVEDNELNRRMIAAELRQLGVEVLDAADGEAALALLAQATVDLVLLDVHMPRMDGVSLARAIRARDPALPLYALTANVIGSEEQELAEAGVRGVLYKPIDETRLHALLQRYAAVAAFRLRESRGVSGEEMIAELRRLERMVTDAILGEHPAAAVDAAHQLQGAARMFTDGGLATLCLELESALRGKHMPQAADALAAVRRALRAFDPGRDCA